MFYSLHPFIHHHYATININCSLSGLPESPCSLCLVNVEKASAGIFTAGVRSFYCGKNVSLWLFCKCKSYWKVQEDDHCWCIIIWFWVYTCSMSLNYSMYSTVYNSLQPVRSPLPFSPPTVPHLPSAKVEMAFGAYLLIWSIYLTMISAWIVIAQ